MESNNPICQVISYSSQDKKFPAKNMMNIDRPWLCAPNDKSDKLVGEFQLERANFIDGVEIGNYGSGRVEVKVKLSFNLGSSYVSFLDVTLLSLEDSNEENSGRRVYRFGEKDLSATLMKQRWDQIKIICTQLYTTDQFGLMYIHLTKKSNPIPDFPHLSFSSSSSSSEGEEVDDNELCLDIPEHIRRTNASFDVICKNTSETAMGLNSKDAYFMKSIAAKHQEIKNLFLTANKPYNGKTFRKVAVRFFEEHEEDDSLETCEEYYDEFLKYREQTPTAKEKRIFNQVFLDMTDNGIHEKPYKSFWKSQVGTYEDDLFDTSPPKTEFPIESFEKAMNGFELNKGKCLTSLQKKVFTESYISHYANSYNISNRKAKRPAASKKRNVSSEKRPRLSKKEQSPMKQAALRKPEQIFPPVFHKILKPFKNKDKILENFARYMNKNNLKFPPKTKVDFTRQDDFIQSDGQQPSTSRGIHNDVCPICEGQFPSCEIENHAATCGDTPKSKKKVGRPTKIKIKNSATTCGGASKTKKKVGRPNETKVENPATFCGEKTKSKKKVGSPKKYTMENNAATCGESPKFRKVGRPKNTKIDNAVATCGENSISKKKVGRPKNSKTENPEADCGESSKTKNVEVLAKCPICRVEFTMADFIVHVNVCIKEHDIV